MTNLTSVANTAFHFRPKKVDGVETKRESITLAIPKLTLEGVADILAQGDANSQALLLDAVEAVIVAHARKIMTEDEAITAESFPIAQLDWQVIANIPKAERSGGGISKETWKEFADDYIASMPEITGKPLDAVKRAANLFVSKFRDCRSNKPILTVLQGQLEIYAASAPNAAIYVECIEALSNRLELLLSLDEADLIGNL